MIDLMKRNKRLFFFSSVVFLGVVITTASLFNKEQPGFSLRKIRSPFSAKTQWSTEKLTEAQKELVLEILSQEFNYLGSGAEVYAFQSVDGRYVIKFFKMKHLIPKTWLKWVPLPGLEKYRSNKIDKRISRQNELFSSYKLAYDDLREETGLIYIHLNKSKDLKMKIRILDRMRKSYVVNLDHYEFVIQRKSQLVHDRITALMQKGNREGALEAIHNLLKAVVSQCKQGYIDRDSGISHNYGFLDDKVIHFDVGRIMRDENAQNPTHYQREILRVGKKIELWLNLEYPALVPDLEEAINAMIDPSLSPQN